MKKTRENTAQECPTCWGRQEYDGKQYQPIYKGDLNGKMAERKAGWINAYIHKNIRMSFQPLPKKQAGISSISYKLL